MKILKIRNSLIALLLLLTATDNMYSQIPSQTLPDFEFLQADKNIFSNKNLPGGKMWFFAFFDVDCDHCQRAVKNIESHYSSLQNASIYIITLDDFNKLRQFMAAYAPGLMKKKNVMLLQDRSNQFLTKFKPYKYPAMFLYSPEKKLLDYEDNPESVFRFAVTIKKLSSKK